MPSRTAVTIADVAKAANVSAATVSFVLNNTKTITPEVRARVETAVKNLGYQPSHMAKALRTGKTATLGLLIPDLTNPYFPKLAQDIERAALRAGYAMLFADSHDDASTQQKALRHLENRGVDMILVVPVVGTDDELTSHVPLVVLDRNAGARLSVKSDEFLGGGQAAKHLLELGHEKFAILAGPQHNGQPGERVQGMLAAIGEAGLKLALENLIFSDYSAEAGRAGMLYLLETAESFTGILASSDTLALGALSALQSAGLQVPNDFSLVGFDDIPWAALSYPPLTSVRQDTASLASQAIEIALHLHKLHLHKLHLDKHGLEGGLKSKPVKTELMVRASSAKPTKTPWKRS